jgi:hypothetical protein
MVQVIVLRVNNQLQSNKSDGSSILIQKCINILRIVSENKDIVTNQYAQFEQSLVPLFEYMADPMAISFEDDILVIVKNLIRRSEQVSSIVFRLFITLEKVLAKNKNCFGDILLSTINYYLVYGRDKIANDQASLELLLKIIDLALFSTESPINFNNAQGAICLQVVFQIFQGTQVLNKYFEEVLDRVLARLRVQGR